jgi:HTH-type transcriptional regulator/antitoxin HipB
MGLSQGDLAVRAGVSRPWISYLEGGKPTIELGRVLRVLEALDLVLQIHTGAEPTDDAPSVDLDALLDDYRSDG